MLLGAGPRPEFVRRRAVEVEMPIDQTGMTAALLVAAAFAFTAHAAPTRQLPTLQELLSHLPPQGIILEGCAAPDLDPCQVVVVP
jgi:hypothetical protein